MTNRVGWMILRLAFILSLPTLAQAAGDDASVVATVNGEPQYFEDVERQLQSLHSRQTETQRAAFDLDRLMTRVVNDALLAQEARLLGMDKEEPIPQRTGELREEMARQRLEREQISSRVQLDDDEIRRLFEGFYQGATFRLLTADEREKAEALRAEVSDGDDMETVAGQAGDDPFGPHYRRFEGIRRIDVAPEIKAVVFDLEPGQIGGPFSTKLGWSIVYLESLEEADEGDFDEAEPRIRKEAGYRKADEFRKDLAARLREMHAVSIDAELADVRCERLPDGRLAPVVEHPEKVVVEAGGRPVTVDAYGKALKSRWLAMRNEEAALASRPIVLDRIIDHELTIAEALKRGYGESPEVERAVKSYVAELVVPRYLTEVLAPTIEVTPEEMESYYESHLEEFRQLPRIKLGQITLESKEEADQIVKLLRQDADLGWVAQHYSVDEYKNRRGDRGWILPDMTWGDLQGSLVSAEAGAILGPFQQAEDGFLVLKVVDTKDRGFYRREKVSGNLRQAVWQQNFRKRLEEVLVQLREESEIVIHEDVLAGMRISGSESAAPAPHGEGH